MIAMLKKPKETPEEREERVKGYDIAPDEDMSGHGWLKEVTFKFLSDIEGIKDKLRCTEVDFYTKDQSHACGSNKFLWLSPQRNGVYLCCTWCQTSEGPITSEFGITRKTYEISVAQGIQIMLERGWNIKDLPIRGYLKRAKKTARTFIPRARPKKSR